jgi:hypothetical protein
MVRNKFLKHTLVFKARNLNTKNNLKSHFRTFSKENNSISKIFFKTKE